MKLQQASVKAVQKAMSFPTPAQAKYHLKRLVELGLVSENGDGSFKVVYRKFGVLRFFFKMRDLMIPMSLFYTIFFGCLTAAMLIRMPTIEVALLGGLVTAKEAADTYSYYAML